MERYSPTEVVALYQSGLSLGMVGKMAGVTGSAIRYHLIRAGIPRRPLQRREFILFNGKKYCQDSSGYFAETSGKPNGIHERLHRDVWRFFRGEIPAGCDIHHKFGNLDTTKIEDLECLTKPDHSRLHAALNRESIELKPCENCGIIMPRRISNGILERKSLYRLRKLCSFQCLCETRSKIMRGNKIAGRKKVTA